MFTGLIESVGYIVAVESAPGGVQLRIRTPLASDLSPGESLAVNGVCLTVLPGQAGEAVGDQAGTVAADLGPETCRVTTLGRLSPGQAVNLERSLRADGRLGGHFVTGHVDATARVLGVRPDGDAHWMTVELPSLLAPLVVPKGSVAVDGVSLTVAELAEGHFDVMLIPHTWTHTNLRDRAVGDHVNLEGDMIGKFVARAMGLAAPLARDAWGG